MIVVTHLLGTGHLARALTLARAFQAAGDTVTVVSGGMPVAQLDRGDVPLVQLPPVRSDGVDFSTLLTADTAIVTPDDMAQRQNLLLETFETCAPDVLITELYPFGRRILRTEFRALLEAAHARNKRPIICASVRDILAPPSKQAKADAAHDMLATYYDRVLVHSDEELMPLHLSWPLSPAATRKIIYTGFVAPEPASLHPQQAGANEVLVSAGGGNVGMPLFKTMRAAAALMPEFTFRLLVGGTDATKGCAALTQNAPSNLIAEPARRDFRQMLNHVAVSVSMCGYNTALDVLQTGCPAVFVPFDAGSEVEQSIRARALAAQDGIETILSAEMTPETMRAALVAVSNAPPRAPLSRSLHGAANTQRAVHALVNAV